MTDVEITSPDMRSGDVYEPPPGDANFAGCGGLDASVYAEGDHLGRSFHATAPKGAFELYRRFLPLVH